MQPRIVDLAEMTLVGMVTYGVPGKDTGDLWARFMAQEKAVSNVVSGAGYEAYFWDAETKGMEKETIFVGVEVEEVQDLPLEMFVKLLPASKCALFAVSPTQLGPTLKRIYEEWLPGSVYEQAHAFLLEVYDGERFKGMDHEESKIDICVPIRSKE